MNGTDCSPSFNWTENEITNTSLCDENEYEYETKDDVITAVLFLVCIWIILTNSIVAMCFIGSRELQKNLWNLQILSLSFSDVLVGFTSLLVALGYSKPKMFMSYNACSIMFIFYVSSQMATFFHTFCICLHRFVIVFCRNKSPNPYQGISKRNILFQVLIVWSVSSLFCMIPFIAFGRWGSSLMSCDLYSLFIDQYILSISLWNVSLLVPQIIVNILYLSIYLKLRCTWTKVMTILPMNTNDMSLPGNVKHKVSDSSTIVKKANANEGTKRSSLKAHPRLSPCNDRVQMKDIHDIHSRNDDQLETQTPEKPNEYTNTQLHVNCTELPSTSRGISENRAVTNVVSTKCAISARQMNTKQQLSNLPNDSSNSYTRQNRHNHSRHAKILVTIGIILITVNVCVTPMNLLFIFEAVNEGYLSRKTKLTVLTFSLLNSGVNPMIYAFRIKEFRQSLINGWTLIKRSCLT